MTDSDFYPLEVKKVQRETDSAVVLSFSVDEDIASKFRFKQGQYLTLSTEIDGHEVRRSYSVCTGVDENTLSVAIRRVDGGVFSNFVNDSVIEGQTLNVMPPQGEFFTELNSTSEKHYMCIAAGSGITPIISIIKSTLAREPKSRVTLIYGNRRTNTIMFKDELGFIKNQYVDRFNWINVLSQEQQETEVLCGRIDSYKRKELQQSRLLEESNADEYFLCGPQEMVTSLTQDLRDSGVSESSIHYELFFADTGSSPTLQKKREERSRLHGGKVSTVSLMVDGRTVEFPLEADGESILDGAIRNGVDLPFSCKGGVCATCKCRVIEGEVDMDMNHALSDSEITNKMVLACQSHPLTPKVILDFDQK